MATNSDLRTLPHQKCTEFKKIKLKSILFFSQKFPAVANGEEEEEEEEEDDDDDDDDDDEEEEEEEESCDVTVVDTEEVNVHYKLIWDYMCFIPCFMHVKWAQNPVLQRQQYDYTAGGNMNDDDGDDDEDANDSGTVMLP